MRNKLIVILLLFCVCKEAPAAYSTTTLSATVSVSTVYVNENGSPFILFSGRTLTNCYSNGAYLWDLTKTNTDPVIMQFRNYKYATILAAKATNKTVTVSYIYDSTLTSTSWSACYITGMYFNP